MYIMSRPFLGNFIIAFETLTAISFGALAEYSAIGYAVFTVGDFVTSFSWAYLQTRQKLKFTCWRVAQSRLTPSTEPGRFIKVF